MARFNIYLGKCEECGCAVYYSQEEDKILMERGSCGACMIPQAREEQLLDWREKNGKDT